MGFLLQDSTVDSDVYCETLKNLRRAIMSKQREKLIGAVGFIISTTADILSLQCNTSQPSDGINLIIRRTVQTSHQTFITFSRIRETYLVAGGYMTTVKSNKLLIRG